jgi:periplasmic protein CpxP/Spy
MKAFHKHVLIGVMALGLGTSAMAADATMCGDMGSMMQGRGQRMGQVDQAKMAERMKVRMDQRHANLHSKLKLNAEQEVAWKSFIAGAQPPMSGMYQQHAEMAKLSAPDRAEKMLEFMKSRQAFMTARLVELKKFYAVLTPEQQKVFDAEMMGAHRGRGMSRKSGRGMGAGMGPGMGRGTPPAPADAPK